MSEPHRVGSGLAKSVFQAHRASGDGLVEFRKKLRRDHVAPFFAELPSSRGLRKTSRFPDAAGPGRALTSAKANNGP